MVSKGALRQIVILSYLTEPMLDKLRPIVEYRAFSEDEVIFREGDPATRLYMLKSGKVLLEKRISEHITISVGSIRAGYSFGWSSILDGDAYTSDAICTGTGEVFSVQREKLLALFDEDHSMGFIMTQRLMRVIKKRLDYRTEQFLRAIQEHPDTRTLF